MKDSFCKRIVATSLVTLFLLGAASVMGMYLNMNGLASVNPDISQVLSKSTLWVAMATLGIAALFTFITTWFVKKHLSLPVTNLVTFSQRVATGDLEAPITGQYVGEFGPLKDAQQTMVQSLKKNLGYAEGIIDCLSEAFPYLTLDRDGRITHISEKLISYLDLEGTPQHYLGLTPGEAFFGESGRAIISTEALNKRQRVEREADITTDKGKRRVFKVVASPIYDLDGALAGSFTLYFDLTRMREQEEEIRRTNESITALADQTNAIAQEVSLASEELSALVSEANQDANQQKTRSAEVATAMEEMNATVFEVARNSQGAAQQAQEANERASEGARNVKTLVDNVSSVDDVIKALGERMVGLGSQAENIDQVINVINDIADQTNLLALNAAIEAARAGDAGRGFAVVADEVRKLAEKTMAATKEVGSVILGIQGSTKQANTDMEEVTRAVDEVNEQAYLSGAALNEILNLVRSTSDQVQSIATAAEEQSAASEEINRAVGEMDGAATHTSQTMDQAAMKVIKLAGRASDLTRMISQLQQGDHDQGLVELGTNGRQMCWEFKKCGREKGGSKVQEMGVCPAWPDFGDRCAEMEGTFCGGKVQGDYASKIAHCAKCDYFKSGHYQRN